MRKIVYVKYLSKMKDNYENEESEYFDFRDL